jgi:RimJ/RimL family protein N-acetyltransferase
MDAATILERVATGPWSQTTLEAQGGAIVLGVETIEHSTLVGDVMLAWTSERHRAGEIGYVFDPAHSGRGYATEAADELLRLAFADIGLHRVVARVDADNAASLALAERLGMRREAHLVQSWWREEAWHDEVHLAILRDEWDARHRAR